MGMCDPKAIRNDKAWADVVNKTPEPPRSRCNHGAHFRCSNCAPKAQTLSARPALSGNRAP